MFKVPLPEIKEKLVASGKITSEDLENRLKEKINELSGLISEEGAAHIIANELGVQLTNPDKDKLKIKEIYPGMKNVTTAGKVVRKFDVREFAKGESTGKVQSLVLGDDTGTIRIVCWNDQVDLLSEVNEEDIILVKSGYVRENRGNKEVHLGRDGDVEVNPEGITVGEVRQRSSGYERKEIGSLSGDETNVELMGTVVQVFDPRFFNLCGTCNKRVTEQEGSFVCNEHGQTEASLNYVMNAVLDDGSGNIRAVFWKNQTNHLTGKDEAIMSGFKEDMGAFEDIKTDLLGEQFKILGRVQKNDMFNRLEFNVQIVEKANPEKEIERLEKQSEAKKAEVVEQKVEEKVPELVSASTLAETESVEQKSEEVVETVSEDKPEEVVAEKPVSVEALEEVKDESSESELLGQEEESIVE